jgi:hypothetical protein
LLCVKEMSTQELLSQAINALTAWEESVRNLSNAVEEFSAAIEEMKSAEEDEARYQESRCMEDTPSGNNRLVFSPTLETRRRYVEATWNKRKAETSVIQAKVVVTEAMAKVRAIADHKN